MNDKKGEIVEENSFYADLTTWFSRMLFASSHSKEKYSCTIVTL